MEDVRMHHARAKIHPVWTSVVLVAKKEKIGPTSAWTVTLLTEPNFFLSKLHHILHEHHVHKHFLKKKFPIFVWFFYFARAHLSPGAEMPLSILSPKMIIWYHKFHM